MIGGRLEDSEWAFLEAFVIENGPKRGRPPKDHRRVLDGVFWIARTNSPWRDLPPEFGNWSSVYRQFLRWTRAGLWELVDAALTGGETATGAPPSPERAAMRGRKDLARAISVVRSVARRPKSHSARTRPREPLAGSYL